MARTPHTAPDALSPYVRRVLAPNANYMTGPGTNTWLIGDSDICVIDPGPNDAKHVDSIIAAAGRKKIRSILLTHTHSDHAPGAALLAKKTGAPILADPTRQRGVRLDGRLLDGAVVEGSGFSLVALHTPGHAPNHLCFWLEQEGALFTGDNILDGMWSVISPNRGGDMAEYIASLKRMRSLRAEWIAPGHGQRIEDPRFRINEYLQHRRKREKQILRCLGRGPSTIAEIVNELYSELAAPLRPVAGRQVHAHLLKLRNEGSVIGSSARTKWSLS